MRTVLLLSTLVSLVAAAMFVTGDKGHAASQIRYTDLADCVGLNDKDRLSCFDSVANGLKEQSGAAGQGAESGKDILVSFINSQIIEDRTTPGIGGFSYEEDPAPDLTNLDANRFVDCLLQQNDAARMACIDQVIGSALP